MAENIITKLIDYYLVIAIEGDITKMIRIGKEVELRQERERLNAYVATKPVTGMVTLQQDYYNVLRRGSPPEDARCAVPIAMSLLSIMNFFGTLLNSEAKTNDNFDLGIKAFFKFTAKKYYNTEIELLRATYRNAMSHSFFPNGKDVAIAFDSALDKGGILVISNGMVVLNVLALFDLVKNTLELMKNDPSVHSRLESGYKNWLATKNESADLFEKYKKEILKEAHRSATK